MKRVFALALAICMALSMMVLTASAAASCPHGVVLHCTEHPGMEHWYVHSYSGNDYFASCYFNETGEFIKQKDIGREDFARGVIPETKKMYVVDHGDLVLCPNTPPYKPQPKTGVMDTLPVWFGVMAVSACAYILTSKKKVF